MSENRGFAVVGLGKMGIMHAAMLGSIPNAGVAALVDQDPRLGAHVRSMGVEAPAYTDIDRCLEEIRPEGVWIATPQFTHRPLIELCLRKGVPVFCEKPLAHQLDDARAILAAAELHPNLPVAVGFQLAHNPLFHRAAALLREGALGALKSFRASCRLSQVFSPMKGWTFTREKAGGGVLINSGCHLLYVMDLLFGRPKGVFVRARGVHNDVEDTLAALVDFPDGLWGSVEVTWSVPGHDFQTHDFELIGDAGALEVGNQWLRLWLAQKGRDHPAGWTLWERPREAPKASFSLSPDYCGDEFYLEDLDFVEAVRARRPPKVGARVAFRVQEVLDAFYRSADSGRYVELPPESAQ